MNTGNDDNRPCGVAPHALSSWRSKYEYMDRLWIEQKAEIARLQAELSRKDTELTSLRQKIKQIVERDEDPTCTQK